MSVLAPIIWEACWVYGGQRPCPGNPSPQEGHLQLSLENWLSQILVAGPEQGEEGGRGVILGSCLATLGCVQLAPGRCILYPESFSPLALRGLFQKVIVCQCLLAVIRGSGMEFTILGGFLANLITTEGTPRAALSHLTVLEKDVLLFPRSVPVSLLGSLAGRCGRRLPLDCPSGGHTTVLPQTEETEIFRLFLFIQTHLVVP